MWSKRSADAGDGNYAWVRTFQFDCAADGGEPIAYDKTLLAGDDRKNRPYCTFAAEEIECWQL